jgi:hypothetical protein
MILDKKTLETKGYSVDSATSYKRVCVKCDDCGTEYDKIKRDINTWEGRCTQCARNKRGKIMGNEFGRSQALKGKCSACGKAVRKRTKYCKSKQCQEQLREDRAKKFIGPNNPSWTGKHVCKCGSKKSFNAERCRPCSFRDGSRSGPSNGRFIRNDREEYMRCIKIKRIMSSLMSNVCKSGGISKNYRKTLDILGYSWEDFKIHIESQFEDAYSWDAYGNKGWSIDHILPVDWFIQNKVFDIKVVNCLNNLKPLNSIDNIKKSNSIIMEDPWGFYEELRKSAYGYKISIIC